MKWLLALIVPLSIACSGGSDSAPAITLVTAPAVPDDPSPPAEEPAPESLSVFRNFGNWTNGMPLNFDGATFGQRTRRTYYHDSDGLTRQVAAATEHRTDGTHELRLCVDYVTLQGDETEGTITIDSAERVWRYDVNEPLTAYCAPLNGVWNYRVTEDGLVVERAGVEATFGEVL